MRFGGYYDEQRSADDLVERLQKMLPGFEAKADPSREQVMIRGILKIGASVNYELFLLAGSPEVNEATAQRLANEARRLGIEALGIEQEIAVRVEKARADGEASGHAAGKIAGRIEGRREMLAEILAAREDEER